MRPHFTPPLSAGVEVSLCAQLRALANTLSAPAIIKMALTKSATAPILRSSAWFLDRNRNRLALPITTSQAAPITTQVPAAINAPAAAVAVVPAASVVAPAVFAVSAADAAESPAVSLSPAGRPRAVTPVRGGRARQVSCQVLSPIMEDQGQVEASGSGFGSGVGEIEYARPEEYSFPPAHRGRGLSDFDDPFVDASPTLAPGTGFTLQRAPTMSGFRG